ncbi:MAG: alpha-2-macroglobulin, partial [Treponema sp.]|nr:alpha-2-macroglobulin [Treponema sp.]
MKKSKLLSRSVFLLPAIFITAIIVALSFGSCKGPQKETAPATTVFTASHVSAGKTAAGLEGYRITYYEAMPGQDTTGAGSIQESDDPFKIVDFGPQGELPSEIKKPSIYVVFSQPVVPLAKLGDPITEDAGLFTIEPPLTGVYRWYGSRLLSFEPDSDNMPQQEYKITVSDTIKSLGGKSLEGDRTFSFETERLKLLYWELGTGDQWVSPWNADPLDAKNIQLFFSYPVDLDEIAKWIDVSVQWQSYSFTLSRLPKIDDKRYSPEQGVLLTLNDLLPMDSKVNLTIDKGARSEPGWLGTKEDAVFSFQTLQPFVFSNVSVRTAARPRTEEGDSIPIALYFSQSVDPETDPSLFSVQGMPPLTKDNVHFYGSTVVINKLPLEYEKNYQVNISGAIKDLWGRSLGEDKTVTAKVGEANSYVFFLNTGPKMLEAGFPPKVVWEAQNLISLRSLITAATGPYVHLPLSAELKTQDLSKLPKNSKRFFMEDLTPFLGPGGKGSAAMIWNYETRNQWDGKVYKGDSWLTVQVTDIGITMRYAYNTVLVWATKLSTGEPIPGASVELREGSTVVREGKTDSQGLAIFEFRDGEFVSLFTDLHPYESQPAW